MGVPKLLTATFVYALANAFIGCVDDTAKLMRRQNEGLTVRQKIALQIFVSLLYIAALVWLSGPKRSFIYHLLTLLSTLMVLLRICPHPACRNGQQRQFS